ncbi:hypothetical protein, partial [Bradyrhizobium sp. NBAIM08]|uniref:hypothetical protein n=1 Tax=Bradyrhizobium sp. NBAIM08 TaxID=2793815 RepID=UPI001CD626FE
ASEADAVQTLGVRLHRLGMFRRVVEPAGREQRLDVIGAKPAVARLAEAHLVPEPLPFGEHGDRLLGVALGEGDEENEPVDLDGAVAGPSEGLSPMVEAPAGDEAEEAPGNGTGAGAVEVVETSDAIETVAEDDD